MGPSQRRTPPGCRIPASAVRDHLSLFVAECCLACFGGDASEPVGRAAHSRSAKPLTQQKKKPRVSPIRIRKRNPMAWWRAHVNSPERGLIVVIVQWEGSPGAQLKRYCSGRHGRSEAPKTKRDTSTAAAGHQFPIACLSDERKGEKKKRIPFPLTYRLFRRCDSEPRQRNGRRDRQSECRVKGPG